MEVITTIKELVLTAAGIVTAIVVIRKEVRESREDREAHKAKHARDE